MKTSAPFSSLLLLLVLFAGPLRAQRDCKSIPPFEEALEASSVVFAGTVVNVSTNPHKSGLNIVFQIDSSWKRTIEEVVTLHTGSSVQGGYPFSKGERYLVFARKKFQSLKVGGCSRTSAWNDSPDDLQRLGAGLPTGQSPGMQKMIILVGVLGIVGLLFVGFVVLRKRIFGKKGKTA